MIYADEANPDLFEQLLALLQALLMPVWNDLIVLIPFVLVGIVLLFLLYIWWLRRKAGERNRPRLIPRGVSTPPPGVHLPGPSWWPFFAPIALALILFGVIFNPALIAVGLIVGIVPLVLSLRQANQEWRQVAAESTSSHAAMASMPVAALPSGTWRLPAAPPQLAPVTVAVVRPEPPPGVHMPGPSPWPFFAPIALTVIFFGVIFSPWLILGGVLLGVVAAGGWLRDALREWRSTESVGHAVPATMEPTEAWPRRLVTVFGVVVVVALVLTALPSLGVLLSSGTSADASPTPLVVPARPEITAINEKSFETSLLVVPAGRPFELVFHNQQAGIPHNVKITDGPAAAQIFFDGEVVNGPIDVTYQVPALNAGDYYFLCKVHANMNGTVKALPETGPGGGPGSSPGSSPAPGASGAAPSP